MSPAHRFLYVDDDGLLAYRREHGRLGKESRFTGDEAGLIAFSRYLEENADATFTLLADLAGESLHAETIPALRGAERRSVIERRLARHFPDCRQVAAIPLARERGRRRDERLLLAALTETQALDRWLRTMHDSGVAIAGIHSPALLAGSLLRHVAADAAAPILLFLHDAGRLREIYCAGGQALFTRLIPADGDEMTATLLVGEAARLQRYLHDRGLLDGEAPLPALVVAAPATVGSLGPLSGDGLDFSAVDTAACARSCGMPEGGGCELPEILLHLLAVRPPRHQFAAAPLRRPHLIRRTASAAFAAGIAALVAALLFAGMRTYQADTLTKRSALIHAETASLEQRRHLLAATLPAGWSPAAIVAIARLHDETIAGDAAPREFLGSIGRALAAVPEAQLSRLGWQSGDAGDDRLHLVLHGEIPHAAKLDELVERLRVDRRLGTAHGEASAADGATGRRFTLPLTWQPR